MQPWELDVWSFAIGVMTPFLVMAIYYGIARVIEEKDEWNSQLEYEESKHHAQPVNPSQRYWKDIAEATDREVT